MRVVFGRLTFDDGKMDGINRQEGRNLGGNSYRSDTRKWIKLKWFQLHLSNEYIVPINFKESYIELDVFQVSMQSLEIPVNGSHFHRDFLLS